MSKSQPESSPVHGSIAGRRRGGGGLCDRRDQVVGPDHRRQRHGPHRRGRAQRAGRLPRRASSPRCRASRSSTWSIPTRRTYAKRLKQVERRWRRPASRGPGAGHREGHPPRAGGQVGRRDLGRHAQPLARADDDLGLPGGQGRLRREAVQPQRPRGPRSPSRPRGSTTGSSSTARRAAPTRRGPRPSRPSGRASSASCWSRGPSATSPARASASSRSPTPPEQLDFDIWLGPAPKQPYHANLVHYNWHWFWDFGNGDIGNQGVHQMDIARWLIPRLGPPAARPSPRPSSAWAAGSAISDQGQTANTQISVMDYGDTQLIFEVRGLTTGAFHGVEGRQHRPPRSRDDRRRRSSIPRGRRKPVPLVEGRQGRGPARAGQGPLRQLHRRRAEPQGRGPQRRHPRGALLRRALPPGQHLLPARRGRPVQQADRGLRRRQGSLRDARPAWRSTSRRTRSRSTA